MTGEAEPDASAQVTDSPERASGEVGQAGSERLRRFEDEHAAVRRVATLVAKQAPASELFAAVVDEVVDLFGVPGGWLFRYEPGPSVFVLASSNVPGYEVGSRYPFDGPSVSAMVLASGRPARIDDYEAVGGTIASRAADSGFRSGVGVPVTVDGTLWGALCVGGTSDERLPDDTEDRLEDFTELIGAAISNAEARDGLARLAEQQAALRRLATLVVERTPADEFFAAVWDEVTRVLGIPAVAVCRCEPDRMMTVLTTGGGSMFAVGSRWPLDGLSVVSTVFETGRPARIDDYSRASGRIAEATRDSGFNSVVGAPIIVEGRVWGLITTASRESEPLPADTADRLRDFTELIATAIYNMQARDDLQALADEQAALRRIATLVASGAEARTVFDAICVETEQLVGATSLNLAQFIPGDLYLAVAGTSLRDTHIEPGTRLPLGDDSISAIVARTAAPARLDSYEEAEGDLARFVRSRGVRASVAAPILVEGKLWGAVIAGRDTLEPFPPGAENRVARFAELAGTAIANATARSELIASRARIVAAGDEARARIERNLHDGVQQRLIALGLDLQVVQAMLPQERDETKDAVEQAKREVASVLDELRELSRGLHPPLLASRGLGAALRVLARRSPIGVELKVELDSRPPAAVETATYYVVSEAMANAVKYSHASLILVMVAEQGSELNATIIDDGVGGAAATDGSGLAGLIDRVAALGGRLTIDSPPGRGTTISAQLPEHGPGGTTVGPRSLATDDVG